MNNFIWYIKRLVRYHLVHTNYKTVYGSFKNYCEARKNYEYNKRKKS